MDRRTAIKRTSLIMGTALSAGTMAGLVAGCKAEKKLDWEPAFFSPDEAKTISSLTDTILPKTETPGASEVGVPEFIDDLIGNFWNENDQSGFKSKLANVNQLSEEKFGDSYFNLTGDEQNQIMDQLVDEATNHSDSGKPFFRELKELTYSGYFSSEIIGEQVLAYDPVPGTYIGDLPIDEVDNAWSL
ncbi:gluconate 2-dehydrogenase subunit 3 family protein [Membranihabitans maritimus]|uniref:gluconate 2-dehydrogenase subunit 3 family protein n=1 Tax=Membranihabitans maritimus TaxID=2904244 RepID=UPI001F2B0EDD|nr:gluconate 2-dehydrogenase subunit 3 family protein [Membranihabitans maritimus]